MQNFGELFSARSRNNFFCFCPSVIPEVLRFLTVVLEVSRDCCLLDYTNPYADQREFLTLADLQVNIKYNCYNSCTGQQP